MKFLLPVLPWLGFGAAVCYALFMPTSYWLSVSRIYVASGVAGGPSPQITLDAEVRRDVVMHFSSVLKKNVNGSFYTVCSIEGTRHVPPRTQFNYDVAQFFGNMPCALNLEAGQYFIDLSISWMDVVVSRAIFSTSNVFTVSSGVPTR